LLDKFFNPKKERSKVIDTGDTAFILAAAIVLGPRKGYGKEKLYAA